MPFRYNLVNTQSPFSFIMRVPKFKNLKYKVQNLQEVLIHVYKFEYKFNSILNNFFFFGGGQIFGIFAMNSQNRSTYFCHFSELIINIYL